MEMTQLEEGGAAEIELVYRDQTRYMVNVPSFI